MVVDAGRPVTDSGTQGWRSAITGGVGVWVAVKAAMTVLALLLPAIRGGTSMTDPAGQPPTNSLSAGTPTATLPAERVKNDKQFVLPLSRAAQEIVALRSRR